MKLLVSLAIVFGISTIAVAKTQKKTITVKSSFDWSATKKIGKGHGGKISLKSYKIEMAGDMLANAEFIMDMSSFTVEDLDGKWEKKFLTHIKSDDFFDIKKFPVSKLVLNKQTKAGVVSGKLTIKDKTNPVTIKYKKSGTSYTGTLIFDRTKYDMIYGSGNFFKELAADKIINNDVTLKFNLTIK